MSTTLPVAAVAELRHELRTPVNLIVGYAEMLLEDLEAGDARAAHYGTIRAAADDVLQRINSALPSGGDAAAPALAMLLEGLAEPQRQIIDAAAALLHDAADEETRTDLARISHAAEQLTHMPRLTPATSTAALPGAAQRSSPPATPRVVPAASTRSTNILVVDDLADNRDVLARRLVRQGHAVVLAENGRVALDRLRDQEFDLVLLDVIMPEVDGFEVLEQMQSDARLKRIPVMMISALDDLSSVVRCIESGAEDYLSKPFDPVLLRARIGAALHKKHSRDRRAEYLEQVGRITEAAAAFERGEYTGNALMETMRRDDELGRLARVFHAVVAGVRAQEERLRTQLRDLRAEVTLATSEMPVAGADDDLGVLRAGSLFANRYEVSRILGRGGMGMVYQAHDRQLGENVAVKMLSADLLSGDSDAVERFKNEIRLARRISHHNVVRTHDLGECDGAYFVTMEYVRGLTVRELLETRGKLSVSSTLALVRQLVAALAVAHGAGVLHRDVKPENALVDADGVLKVMDFGIARLTERTSTLTQAGMILGTPAYMSPEQLLGEEIDARADLYAVGAVMFECLTGMVPFSASSPIAMIGKVLTVPAAFPAGSAADIPPAMAALVLRLLAKDAAERPPHADDLLELLREIG